MQFCKLLIKKKNVFVHYKKFTVLYRQYSTVQDGTVLYSTVLHCTVRTVQYCTVLALVSDGLKEDWAASDSSIIGCGDVRGTDSV